MINEDAPTNSVGTGAETSLPPASEPPGTPRGWKIVKRWKKNKKKDIYESKTGSYAFLVTLPNIGDTIVYAKSPTELKTKLRKYIKQVDDNIKMKRLLPNEVIDFFTQKRIKAMKGIKESSMINEQEGQEDPQQQRKDQMQNASASRVEAQKRIALAKKQAAQNLAAKKQEMQRNIARQSKGLQQQAKTGQLDRSSSSATA